MPGQLSNEAQSYSYSLDQYNPALIWSERWAKMTTFLLLAANCLAIFPLRRGTSDGHLALGTLAETHFGILNSAIWLAVALLNTDKQGLVRRLGSGSGVIITV